MAQHLSFFWNRPFSLGLMAKGLLKAEPSWLSLLGILKKSSSRQTRCGLPSFIKKRPLSFILTVLLLMSLSLRKSDAIYDFKRGAIIQDSEISALLYAYTNPIFSVAGLSAGKQKFIIIVDPDFNAAATIGNLMILNTGLFSHVKSPRELIGVLAHEIGHMAGQHIVKGINAQDRLLAPSLLASLLGSAVSFLAGGGPEAIMASLYGGMHMGERSFLLHSRGQESAADQAALRFLDQLKWSSQGLVDVLATMSSQDLLLAQNQDPYVRTHPLTQERIKVLEDHCQKMNPHAVDFPADFYTRFNRVKIKVLAFVSPPDHILSMYPPTDLSLEATYARSIAYLKKSHTQEALKEIEILLASHPTDPYFMELKGQILYGAGRVKEATSIYKKVHDLTPNDPIIAYTYAHCLLELSTDHAARDALVILESVLKREKDDPWCWKLKAVALGRLGRLGASALALSEFYGLIGDKEEAKKQAHRAHTLLTKKDPSYMRAQDVLTSLEETPTIPSDAQVSSERFRV